MEIAVIFGLILLNGMFAMAEIALVTARRARLQVLATDCSLADNLKRIECSARSRFPVVRGIVTLKDVMEAITGEFKPSSPEDAWAVQREDGTWLLDGLIPVAELKHRLALRTVPEEDRGRYNTLSGMIMLLLANMPVTCVKSQPSFRRQRAT